MVECGLYGMYYHQIDEDLHFVLRMRHTFESLGYQSGFYLSQLFSSNRNNCSPSKQIPTASRPPPQAILNWSQRPLTSTALTNFHNAGRIGLPTKDDGHLFRLPHSSDAQMEDMITDHDSELKWPNGLSFFTALTGRTEDAKVLFGAEVLGNKPPLQHSFVMGGKNSIPSMSLGGNADDSKASASDAANSQNHANGAENNKAGNDYLSLDSHSNNVRKMENKFKRSFTLPARMGPSSSSSIDSHCPHHLAEEDYRNSAETGMYTDIMENFLD